MHYNLSEIALRLKRFVIELSIHISPLIVTYSATVGYKGKEICDKADDTLPFVVMLLIVRRLRKFVIKFFPKNILCQNIVSIDARSKKNV